MGYLGAYWDRTQEQQKISELSCYEAQAKQIAAQGQIGYWGSDLSGCVTFYDEVCASLFGASDLSELLGMNWLAAIDEQDRQRVEQHWLAFVKAARVDDVFIEQYAINTEASQVTLKVYGTGVFAHGELVSFAGTITDITKEHQRLVQLAELEQRYQLTQDMTKTGSWHFDLNTHKVWWSQNCLLYTSPSPRD